MKISVIVPTYNPGNYLKECLSSLYSQSFPREEYEVIIVLNGDRDPYEGVIQDYISDWKDFNGVLLYSKLKGVSNARNLGLQAAKGEYIAFVDDDDFVSESYLEELLLVSDKDTIGLAYPYAFDDGNLKKQLRYYITEEYEHCVNKGKQSYYIPKKFFSGPCMKLMHRDIISNRRFDCRFRNGEDSLFMFLLSDRFKDVNFTSRKAIYYRRNREGSAVSAKKHKAYWLKNQMKLCFHYTAIYFSQFPHYNFGFYLTRLLGAFHLLLEKAIS